LRLPYGLVLMGATLVHFVPVVAGEWASVRLARRRRGRPAWARSPWAWLRLEVSLLRPVVARALRRARALAESLDTRGFHPTAPRTEAGLNRVSAVDLLLFGAFTLTTTTAVAARVTYALYGLDIYYHPSLRPLYAWVRAWL
jgi:energy-coupling factor transporter transmembrane protein EcfT